MTGLRLHQEFFYTGLHRTNNVTVVTAKRQVGEGQVRSGQVLSRGRSFHTVALISPYTVTHTHTHSHTYRRLSTDCLVCHSVCLSVCDSVCVCMYACTSQPASQPASQSVRPSVSLSIYTIDRTNEIECVAVCAHEHTNARSPQRSVRAPLRLTTTYQSSSTPRPFIRSINRLVPVPRALVPWYTVG